MEIGNWELLKNITNWIIYPILCILAWFLKDKSQEINAMKQDIAQLHTRQAVSESQIKDIRDDIKELSQVVKESTKAISEDIKDLRSELKGR